MRAPRIPAVREVWWRPRHWRLRSKLAAALTVPMTAALVFAGLAAVEQWQQARRLSHTGDQLAVAELVSALVHELQAERALAVAAISGGVTAPEQLTDQVVRVDAAARRLAAAARPLAAAGDELSAVYGRGVQRLQALEPLRTARANTQYPVTATHVSYTAILRPLVSLQRDLTLAYADRELLRLGTTAHAVGGLKEFVAQENAALLIAAGRNHFPAGLLDRTRVAEASARAAVGEFQAISTPRQQQAYSDTMSGRETDRREQLKATALVRAAEDAPLGISGRQLADYGTAVTGKLRQVEHELLTDLREHAGRLVAEARTTAWLFAVVMAATLVAALVMVLVIARSLSQPLRTLRSAALNVAQIRLPETVRRILADPDPLTASVGAVEPVPVDTREEIGEVARSFDMVQESAVRLATEQALLRENVNRILVNLSRRSQVLVERQLGVIDRLEAAEQDPDLLASLFELDHLATRLRRNGESLLVLSGEQPKHAAAAPLTARDVIKAAVSEIDQFARIEVGAAPELAVHGRAVNDLVHLLAELLDNATYFSGPQTRVSVRAVTTRTGSLAIQLTDRGIGLTDEEIAVLNERLAEPPDLDIEVTKRMGLYVVAKLALRHGITVRLKPNDDIDGGLVARVEVPAAVLTQPVADPVESSDDDPQAVSGIPVRLDDLISGPPDAAGPYLGSDSAAVSEPPAEPPAERPDVPPAELRPETRPERITPGWPDIDADDDPAAYHLPIYDAVVSYWFTDEGDPAGGPETSADDWFSPADPGWQAARALSDSQRAERVTPAGLPKRVANANLVPGSVERRPRAQDTPVPARPTAEDAATARTHMGGFQHGFMRARQAVLDDSALPARASAGASAQTNGQWKE